jgi:phenylpropionate dioxygenase-like ring-hydroxylating dioxygenase large terminal subunit
LAEDCRPASGRQKKAALESSPAERASALPALPTDVVCYLHPVLPEMEGEGWTSDDFVRDFDVDYTLIMENLMDPDHGLFAHQVRCQQGLG